MDRARLEVATEEERPLPLRWAGMMRRGEGRGGLQWTMDEARMVTWEMKTGCCCHWPAEGLQTKAGELLLGLL